MFQNLDQSPLISVSVARNLVVEYALPVRFHPSNGLSSFNDPQPRRCLMGPASVFCDGAFFLSSSKGAIGCVLLDSGGKVYV